jgi:hypothetical protein
MTTIYDSFMLGTNAGGTGTYDLSGNAILGAKNIIVGGNNYANPTPGGKGIFNQKGGSLTAGGTITVSSNPGTSSGTFNLSGGKLTAANIINNGTFNFSGGELHADLKNGAAGIITLSGPGMRVIDGSIVNNGKFKVSGTNAIFTGTYTNNGSYISDPSTQSFTNLIVNNSGYLVGGVGDTWIISNSFINNSAQTGLWDTEKAALSFLGSGTEHFAPGDSQTFRWGTMTIGSGVTLNIDSDSLYVDSLYGVIIDQLGVPTNILGSTPGREIYYAHLFDSNGNPLAGDGSLELKTSSVPIPATVWLFTSALMGLFGVMRRSNKT